MAEPPNTLETELAKAIMRAVVGGRVELAAKVPARFGRAGKAEQERAVARVDQSVTALAGGHDQREVVRQEMAWETLLQELLADHPAFRGELEALLAELRQQLCNAPRPSTPFVINSLQGQVGNSVQANRIDGSVHFHQPPDDRDNIRNPIITTVELKPGACLADLVVDADPPRPMTPSDTLYVVTVEARPQRAVILESARAVVLSRRPPRPACLETRAGRAFTPRYFKIDFDADPPLFQADGKDFPFLVSTSDPEQFWFEAIAHADEIAWQLELDWICAGRRGRTVINNNGKPFEIYPWNVLFGNDGEPSFLHPGCDMGFAPVHVPGCPAIRLNALSPGTPHNTWGVVNPQ
jgi:hypothetical protein